MSPGHGHEEVYELFALAVALAPDERTRLLDARCRNRPELRLEIESLVAADSRSMGGFLRSPIEQFRRVASEDAEPLAEAPGDQMGPFTLVSRLAEGGCGVVFLAQRREPSHRVALKIIKPGLTSSAVLEAFQAERQTLALMDHPNIARFYDAGVSPAGRPWFAMEFVDGERITEHCRVRRLPVEARLRLFLEVCSAVQHAHARGVIHRDIKPSNVLVAVNSGVATPKVIDFGVAKALGGVDGRAAPASFGIGTPAYMSPEQAVGAPDIDTRADVYGLGALLFELLTDAPPYDHATLARLSHAELGGFLAGTAPRTALEANSAARVAPEIEMVAAKALSRDRRARHSSAEALAEDVTCFLERRPVSAHPRTVWYALRKLMHRRALLLAVTGMLTAAAIIAIAAVWRAEVMEARKRDEARRAGALSTVLFNSAFMAAPGFAGPAATTTAELNLQLARSLDAGALADQPLLESSLRSWVGRNLAGYPSHTAEARRHLERAMQLRAGMDHEQLGELAADSGSLAEGWAALGDLKQAESLWMEQMETLKARHAESTYEGAQTLLRLSQLRSRQGRTSEAEPLVRRAADIFERLEHGEAQAECMRRLAILAAASPERASEATLLARRSLELSRAFPDDVGVSEMLSLHTIGYAAKRADDLSAAELAMREAVASPGFAKLGNHRWTAHLLRDLANLLWEREKLGEAEGFARLAVNADRALAPDLTGLPDSLNRLAAILRDQGKLAEAEGAYREQLELLLGSGADGRALGPAKVGLADTLCRAGRPSEEAVRLAREAVALRTRLPERSSYGLRNARVILGTALALCGRAEEAAPEIGAAVQELREDRGVSAARAGLLFTRAADAYELIGRPDLAAQCRAASPASNNPNMSPLSDSPAR